MRSVSPISYKSIINLKDLEDEARIKRELAEQSHQYTSEEDRLKARVAERTKQTEQALQALTTQHALALAEKQLANARKLAAKGFFRYTSSCIFIFVISSPSINIYLAFTSYILRFYVYPKCT